MDHSSESEEMNMSNTKVKDYEEILRVAQLYVDGCAKGDGEMMKPAFHESATINGAPIQTLFDGCDPGRPHRIQGSKSIFWMS